MRKKQKLKVTIPAGVDTGNRISISGMGDAGPNGGPAGDLYVYVNVRPPIHISSGRVTTSIAKYPSHSLKLRLERILK